jgi:predicted 3-demethylubiquinone-9 3-methyltransferase (glyoxalase superfamily)
MQRRLPASTPKPFPTAQWVSPTVPPVTTHPESACGWCKDKWGVSWQITPRVLTEAMAAGGDEAKRAFDAMMGMKKIDVAAIKAARRG